MAEKRTTIADVARLAETSTATVSHFLNGKLDKMSEATRERIERVIRQTGYVPNAHAQGLSGSPTGVIAVLLEDGTNAWATRLVRGVEEIASNSGFQTVVCDTHFDPAIEAAYVEKMLSLGVDGFVLQPTTHYRSVSERLKRAGKPVVFFDFSLIDFSTTWVKSDLYGGVYDAISSCVDRGYEDFWILADEQGNARTRGEREQGAADALAERGIEPRRVRLSHDGPSAEELGRMLALEISPAHRSLIFCLHQWALPRVFRALAPMRELMPDRVGLLGLNNADWTDLTDPGISTVVEPVEEEGRIACSLLIDLMSGQETRPQQKLLPCRARWLGSTL